MNLLPKTSSEFASEKYWNEFFRKRGKAAFEWYGEYWQLAGTICNYLKKTDKLLIVGCGNSSLSADLYDSGYTNNVSIDISDVVIRQMKHKYAKTRPHMQFQQMDAAEMQFTDEEFSVVLDKGTVDALTPNSDETTIKKLSAVLAEVSRVLRVGGRFVCISLLQAHVLEALLKWFCADPSWTWVIRVHRCADAEKVDEVASRLVLPVFVVVFTKLKRLQGLETVTELVLDPDLKPRRVPASTVYTEVSSVQQYAFLRHHMARRRLESGDEVTLELCSAGSGVPRYRLFVCDRPPASSAPIKFAIFIAPQGRESEWLFGCKEGRRHLTASCQAERLVVVHLCRDQTYSGMEEVKNEVSQNIMELAPPSHVLGMQVPFLSAGKDVGQREVRHRGKSALSGEYVIEDVTMDDGDGVRRLIFLDKPHVIQTEAKLKQVKCKGKKKAKVWQIVAENLLCEYYKYMVAGIAFIMPKGTDGPASALMVGLGGGTLPLFLITKFPELKLSVIELDPEVVTIARRWYLPEHCPMDIFVEDGIKTFERLFNEGKKYDLIFLDVDSKDLTEGLTCPPTEFLTDQKLREVAAVTEYTGAVVMNFVCRNETLKKEVYKRLNNIFSTVLVQKIPDNVNEVVYLTNNKTEGMERRFISNVQRLSKILKGVDNADISDLMNGLKVA